jgi:hypothetical protein
MTALFVGGFFAAFFAIAFIFPGSKEEKFDSVEERVRKNMKYWR